MTEKRFTLIKDTEWWFVQDNTIQVNEFGYREDLTGEDKYRGLQQDLTEQETVDLLNKFYEENKKQKDFINQLQEELVFFKTANINVIQRLEEENKELKRRLFITG